MDLLHLEETDETPRVFFDKRNGVFEIAGRSLPEDAASFYAPVLDWLKRYREDANTSTEFTFKLEYCNTASTKFIQDILALLESIAGVKVIWYYQEDDETMEDTGHEFAELVEIPFEFKHIS